MSNKLRRKKTDWELAEIVRRFGVTREEAEQAPDFILQQIPEKPIPLTGKELEHAQKIIEEYRHGKRKPIAVIERRPPKKPKNPN
jgi:hypothetical protein